MKIILFLTLLFVCQVIPAQTYDELIDSSFVCMEKKDLQAAMDVLKEALKEEPANPRNVLLLSNLGTIQRRAGKKEDALISYTAALSRAPENTTLLSNRASLYVELQQPENAITDYTSLLLIDDKDEDALYERGLLYLQVRNFSLAQSDFEKIVEINPNTLKGRLGIASLCKLRKEYEEAEKIYAFLMEKTDDNADVYAGRAELYFFTGKNSRAMSDVNKAISLQPDNSYLYILRARIKLVHYEKKSAMKDIEKAKSLGYDSVEAERLLQLCK